MHVLHVSLHVLHVSLHVLHVFTCILHVLHCMFLVCQRAISQMRRRHTNILCDSFIIICCSIANAPPQVSTLYYNYSYRVMLIVVINSNTLLQLTNMLSVITFGTLTMTIWTQKIKVSGIVNRSIMNLICSL